jgi:hypothetical protein
MQTLT